MGANKIQTIKTLSHCNCVRTVYKEGILICSYAKDWLLFAEKKTDCPIDFERSQELYARV